MQNGWQDEVRLAIEIVLFIVLFPLIWVSRHIRRPSTSIFMLSLLLVSFSAEKVTEIISSLIHAQTSDSFQFTLNRWTTLNYYMLLYVALMIVAVRYSGFHIVSVATLVIASTVLYPVVLLIDSFLDRVSTIPKTDILSALDSIDDAYSKGVVIGDDDIKCLFSTVPDGDYYDVNISFAGSYLNNIDNVRADLNISSAYIDKTFASDDDAIKSIGLGVGVAKGFFDAFDSIRPQLVAFIGTLTPSKIRSITVSGHSLGGSICAITALYLAMNSKQLSLRRK